MRQLSTVAMEELCGSEIRDTASALNSALRML